MRFQSIGFIFLCFSGLLFSEVIYSQERLNFCNKAFLLRPEEADTYGVVDTIKICIDAYDVPIGYMSTLNKPVCEDTLCYNLVIKIYWDLAGGYLHYDTIPGIPLTKFDHKPFTNGDNEKLDEILRDKFSILGKLWKEDIINKNNTKKASSVDAVTGATQESIRNSVVEGAAYSSFVLWQFVYGQVKDSIRTYTRSIYSENIAKQLLNSSNYETQMFALKQMTNDDYEAFLPLLFQMIKRSVPFVRSYIISHLPLSLLDNEQKRNLISLFPELDINSKTIFIDRFISGPDSIIGSGHQIELKMNEYHYYKDNWDEIDSLIINAVQKQ